MAGSHPGPDLSVVLPVRDVAPYLPTMLGSLQRNGSSIEVVVVDDGSRDATPAVLDDHRRRLPAMTVLRNEAPVGLADARNQGLAATSGRWITYADGDDWLAPGYLDALLAAQGLRTDFVRVDHVRATGHQREVVRAPQGRRGVRLDPRAVIGPADRSTLVDYCYAWAGVYHRGLAEDGLLTFPGGLRTAEDRPWVWRLHLRARSCAVVPLAGYRYRRQVPGSLTAVGDERQLDYLRAFATVLDDVRDEGDDALLEKAVRSFLAVAAHHLGEQDRLEPALRRRHRRELRRAVRALPAHERGTAITALGPARAALLRRVA